jgi:uncharacterized membrane protein
LSGGGLGPANGPTPGAEYLVHGRRAARAPCTTGLYDSAVLPGRLAVLAAYLDGPYKLILVLHILVAIVGFGWVFLHAVYFAQARGRRGAEGLAIAQAHYLASSIARYFMYAVLVTGILLVLFSDDVWEFGDTWIWASIALYILGIGIADAVLQPNLRRMNALMEQLVHMGAPPPESASPAPPPGSLPPQVEELQERSKRVGLAGALLNVDVVLILALMVWKPG